MRKRALYIRVDGDNAIGTGHVMRMLSLALILDAEWKIQFLIQEREPRLIETLRKAGFVVRTLPKSEDFNAEAIQLAHSFRDSPIVVLDNYHFDTPYQNQLLPHCHRLISFDDLNSKTFVSHVLINHAATVKPLPENIQPYTKVFLGPNYALLRPEFFRRRQKPIRTNLEQLSIAVLICMGGADRYNHSLWLCQLLAETKLKLHISIILGAANNNRNAIVEWQQNSAPPHLQLQLLENLDARAMASQMEQADIMLCPPSGISIEACAITVPMMSPLIAENQRHVAKDLTEADASLVFDAIEKQSAALFKTLFLDLVRGDKLRHKQILAQEKLVDLKSGERLRAIFDDLDKADSADPLSAEQIKLVLRPATLDDAEILLRWRNDAETRNNSLSTAAVSLEDHLNWLRQTLTNPKRKILLGEMGQLKIGTVRIDEYDNECELSWTIAPEVRGRGLGKLMVKQAAKLRGGIIRARIKSSNIASQKIAEFAGFSFESQADNVQTWYYKKM